MIIKKLIFFLEYNILNLTSLIIHELSHYIVALLGFILSINSFPVLNITKVAKYKVNDDGTTNTQSWSGNVTFNSDNSYLSFIFVKLITLAPAITTVLLLIYSPMLIKVLVICNLQTLWLSVGDVRDLKESYNKWNKLVINIGDKKDENK